MWYSHRDGYETQRVFRKASHVSMFVLGLKGERTTGRDSLPRKQELQCPSEVMGVCSWARGTGVAPGKQEREGLWEEGPGKGVIPALQAR